VFTRIAQQVLEYLHTPHDVEIPANKQVLLARANASDKEMEEGSPDHPGEAIDAAEAAVPDTQVARPEPQAVTEDARDAHLSTIQNPIVPAALRERQASTIQGVAVATPDSAPAENVNPPANGTVVLDVEQGGIVVPSFEGKSVRAAIELAESSGLDLAVVGSGVGQTQSPPAGSHVASGARITVTFGR
jgi:hypothetical protein